VYHAAQGGFDATQDNWDSALEVVPDEVGIYNDCPVRPAVIDTAWGVIIAAARFSQRRVIGDH